MTYTIYPGAPAHGARIAIPPSKSMAHRALLCAALAHGQSTIIGPGHSEDIEATLRVARKLGATVTRRGEEVCVTGCAGRPCAPIGPVDCGESGSTLRFAIPLFSLGGDEATFCGKGRLLARPQSVYSAVFSAQGLSFSQTQTAITARGPLRPGTYTLDGSVSSQFCTGLLLALPFLGGDSVLRFDAPPASRPYLDLTLSMLARFGVYAYFADPSTLCVPGGQQYTACDYTVEGDYSQFAFWGVLGALCGAVDCTGLRGDSQQGDRVIAALLQKAGARVSALADGLRVEPGPLTGFTADLEDCPDLGPVLCVLGALCDGQTILQNTARLKIKESDRAKAMETELRKCGVHIEAGENEIRITGGKIESTGVLSGWNDHRVVMSLAVLAAAVGPLTIDGCEAVAKSYPGFFDDLKSAGIRVEEG